MTLVPSPIVPAHLPTDTDRNLVPIRDPSFRWGLAIARADSRNGLRTCLSYTSRRHRRASLSPSGVLSRRRSVAVPTLVSESGRRLTLNYPGAVVAGAERRSTRPKKEPKIGGFKCRRDSRDTSVTDFEGRRLPAYATAQIRKNQIIRES